MFKTNNNNNISDDEYESMTIKSKISYIAGIEDTKDWNIEDSVIEEGLYLIHYDKTSDLVKWGNIRGWIIDIENKIVVCASYGYTPIITTDKIEYPSTGILQYNDTYGLPHVLDSSKTKFQIGLEGFTIRVFIHRGILYFASHRKIIYIIYPGQEPIVLSNSRWGNSASFGTMMNTLNMFDMLNIKSLNSNTTTCNLYPNTDKLYSPYIHVFMVTYPDMLHVSKENINNGYLSYIGILNIWNPNETSIPISEIELNSYSPSNTTHDISIAKDNAHFFYPPNLTIDQVNNHLLKGFYPNETIIGDPRLGLGECVIAYDLNTEWHINTIRISSSAYTWRSNTRGDHPNLWYQFINNGDAAKIDTTIPDGLIEFKRRYPILDKYSPSSITQTLKNKKVFMKWSQNNSSDSNILIPDDRFYNIWVCYIMASPLHKQYEVSLMYYKYFELKTKLIAFIYDKYIDNTYNNGCIDNIIEKIIKSSISQVTEIYNIHNIDDLNFNDLVYNAINNKIINSNGSFIYGLFRVMRDTE
uniref:RNA ligase with polynucleotide kinase domain n=1 Tax=Pithovirus LCPAC102 TaxID=2506587 RepID=A0A4D5XFS5_9VIRU|nr:MAG: RNA ligase with polynucleotide kinase domain [Pithovirus LCPAC102]